MTLDDYISEAPSKIDDREEKIGSQIVELDGKDGGGQIVRTALAYSALLNTPIKIRNIRQGRKQPGLKKQHLTAVSVLKDFCNAFVEGDELGSEELMFVPKNFKQKSIEIDMETAGSITLLMQSLLLPLVFSKKTTKLKIIGGTDTAWSMPMDYFSQVVLPQFYKFAKIELSLMKRGYYPKGGGEVHINIRPKFKYPSCKSIKDLDVLRQFVKDNCHEKGRILKNEQGNLLNVKGIAHASSDLADARVGERMAETATHILKALGSPVSITPSYQKTLSSGAGLTVWGILSPTEEIDFDNPIILGEDELGKPGVKSEKLGIETANKFVKLVKRGAVVDDHLADNLIPLLGLFGGEIITSEITKHCKNNIYAVEQFLGERFKTSENKIWTI